MPLLRLGAPCPAPSARGPPAWSPCVDVDAVYDHWGTDEQRALGQTTTDELRSLDLPAGSMGPKVEAVCRFIEHGGALAAIGALGEAPDLLRGLAGTWLVGAW